MKALHTLKVKSEAKSPRKTKLARVVKAKATIKHKWGQGSLGFQVTKKNQWANNHWLRGRSEIFPRSNVSIVTYNEHLAKDCPKSPWINDCIARGKLILQGGFMVEIGAHKSEASNLLKLNCKINNKIMGSFLDLRRTNSFMTL
jgi:hypothetical protein